jgi:tyrosyl-tRNA synthetase
MMAKESVKQRITGDTGISFTEFSYQLIQGYDFVWLYENKGVKLQMGGSDQWGNITTGTELIRKMNGGEAYALTAPLVKKADGGKFGKTEQGNVWLDPSKTSPYQFYQFWLNASDEDARQWIKIFTLLEPSTIEQLILQHDAAPHLRILQKAMAEDITERVHSRKELEKAVKASEILFGKSDAAFLKEMDAGILRLVAAEVPSHKVVSEQFKNGIHVLDLMAGLTTVYASKSEARRAIQANALNINQEKVASDQLSVNTDSLLCNQYLLVRKGKKEYHMIVVE